MSEQPPWNPYDQQEPYQWNSQPPRRPAGRHRQTTPGSDVPRAHSARMQDDITNFSARRAGLSATGDPPVPAALSPGEKFWNWLEKHIFIVIPGAVIGAILTWLIINIASAASDKGQASPSAASSVATSSRPSGLTQDGSFDVGCRMIGTPGYTSYGGVVTLWNSSSSPQSVSLFAIDWGSNGVLLSQDTVDVSAEIAPGTAYSETVSAPASATSCVFAGWNP